MASAVWRPLHTQSCGSATCESAKNPRGKRRSSVVALAGSFLPPRGLLKLRLSNVPAKLLPAGRLTPGRALRISPRGDLTTPDALQNLSGLMDGAEDAYLEIHRELLECASCGLGRLTDAIAGQEAAWVTAVLVLAAYLAAPPGGLWGLLDYFWAPLHAISHRHFSVDNVQVGRQLGEGSFGIVYEGFINTGSEDGAMEHVVLKRVKARVSAAAEMHDVELFMNHRLQRSAPGACAEFLGTMEVSADEAHGKLHQGLWLVWRYEGERTLAHFMKQKSFPSNLSHILLAAKEVGGSSKEDVSKREGALVRLITQQLLAGLRDIHRTGVVHRDVKPSNIVVMADSSSNNRLLRFIDLGACVDLRSGHNYVPHETVLDPLYAAPEKFVMPPQSAALPPDPLSSLISPFLWAVHAPDRFDLYSVGIILMQLCVKQLRTDTGLETFNMELSRKGHDLDKWRAKCRVPDSEFALLDADGGAGWELVRALLRPRSPSAVPAMFSGFLKTRPSAAAALQFRFFRKASFVFSSVPNFSPLPTFPPSNSTSSIPAVEPIKRSTQKKKKPAKAPSLETPSRPSIPVPISSPGLVMAPVHALWLAGAAVADAGDSVHFAGQQLGHIFSSSQTKAPDSIAFSLPVRVSPKLSNSSSEVSVKNGNSLKGNESVEEWAQDAAMRVEGMADGASQSAFAGICLLVAFQGYAAINMSTQMTYELGRSAMAALTSSGALTVVAGTSVLFWMLLRSRPSDNTSEFAENSVDRVLFNGNNVSLSSPSRVQELSNSAWLEHPAPRTRAATGLLEAVREMESQMSSLETSINGERAFAMEQELLLSRMEALLLQPPALYCPWPRPAYL